MTRKATKEIVQTVLSNDETVRPDVMERVMFALDGKVEPVKQKYFNLKELCAIYGISRGTAYDLIKKRIIKPIVLNSDKNGLKRYLATPMEELTQTVKGDKTK